MSLSVVSGRTIEAQPARDAVVSLLREVADRIEAGEVAATTALVAVTDDSAVDSFFWNVFYEGRTTKQFAAIELARLTLLRDIGAIA